MTLEIGKLYKVKNINGSYPTKQDLVFADETRFDFVHCSVNAFMYLGCVDKDIYNRKFCAIFYSLSEKTTVSMATSWAEDCMVELI